MEILDVLNVEGRVIGQKDKDTVHAQGLWHYTFCGWIVTTDGYIVLQRRSHRKKSFPLKFINSVAGHIETGEGLVQGGLREIQEELGLTLTAEALHYAGIQIYMSDEQLKTGLFQNREFAHIYFIQNDTPLADYVLQEEEVEGVYKIKIEDLEALFSKAKDHINVSGYMVKNGQMIADTLAIKIDDFCVETNEYYVKVAIMAERFLQGKSIAI